MTLHVNSSLACVIVHHGSLETTLTCITSLVEGKLCPSLIVVSNENELLTHSLRASLAAVPCTLLEMGRNAGFAAACNVGIRYAMEQTTASYIWLLNNDAVAAPDAASCLLDCVERHPKAVMGTSVFRRDNPERLELALGCNFSPLTTILRPCFPSTNPEEITATPKVDYVYGASMAFPLQLVREIGMLDERFFLYYEEHDFCIRARKAGYTFHWCREAVVWHGREKTIEADVTTKKIKQFHENYSTFLFLHKHYRPFLFFALCFRIIAKLILLPLRSELPLMPSCFHGLVAAKKWLQQHP